MMANPIKDTTHLRSPTESDRLNKPWNNPATRKVLEDQESAQSRNTIIYAILAVVLVVGGYYLYTTEWPSAAVTSTITKTDTAPTANAPAASTTAVPVAPPAVTLPAAGNVPAPATTTTP